jgi:hypothetical protein
VNFLKFSIKKESYENIIDYRVELMLHEIKKDIAAKLKEGFNVSDSFQEKKQIIAYDSVESNFVSPGIPKYISIKPAVKANYVEPYDEVVNKFFNL